MIIDTHCHYNLEPLYGSNGSTWQQHWQKAQAHQVTHSIVVGTNLTSSQQAINIAATEENLQAAVGYHPHAVDEYLAENSNTTVEDLQQWMNNLEQLLATQTNTQHVVAIGEVGLDFFRLPADDTARAKIVELQEQLLIAQIKLADTKLLPLILHVRDTSSHAYSRVLELLSEYKKSNLPFILHCVSGTIQYVTQALELGAYIGVAGNVTYKNADAIRELVAFTPKDRVLAETDAPYLPPHPHRGKTCEPWMIELTAEYLATECDLSKEQLYQNTQTVFPTLVHS